jgi:hypothetical protein
MAPWLALAVFAGVLALGLVAGPVLALVAMAGLVFAAVVWASPHVGLVGMIVAGVGVPFLASASERIPVSVTQLLALFTLASYLHWAMRNRVLPTYAPHMVAMGVFTGVVLASVAHAPDRLQSLLGASIYLRAVLFAATVAFLATTRRTVLLTALALTFAATLSSTLGVAEYVVPGFHIASDDDLQHRQTGATVSTFSLEDDSSIQRVSGGAGNYNWLAYTIAMLMPLNLFWWHAFPRPSARTVVLGITGIQLAAMVLTYTRSAFIGLAVAGAFLVMKRQVRPWVPVSLVLAALVTLPLWAPDRFAERMLSREYLAQGTSVMRRDLVVTGAQMFREHWLLGHGYGQYGDFFLAHSSSRYVEHMREEIERGAGPPESIRPHNMYIDLAVDYGILGLAAFLWLLALLMKDLREVERAGNLEARRLAIVLQASLVVFSVCGLFGHISIMRVPWVLAGFAAALRRVTLQARAAEGRSAQAG